MGNIASLIADSQAKPSSQIDKGYWKSWLESRCKKIIHAALSKLPQDKLELIDSDKSYSFGRNSVIGDSSFEEVNNKNDPTTILEGKIIISDPSAYIDFVKGGSIGAAEAFLENKWHSPDLTVVLRIFARAQNITDKLDSKSSWLDKFKRHLFHRRNRNSQQGSKKNILAHYDLGNELYTRFLDDSMMYSSAIYPDENASLAQAQQYKLQVICEKLELTAGDHLLEIGTGWGSLAIYAAQHFGCKVTTTTISNEQFDFVKNKINKLGLQSQITLLQEDYRNLKGEYSKLVSIEMIEAVGYEYMESFFSQCNLLLKPGGKCLIQAITIRDQRFDSYLNNVDFIQRYIFPGGFLPSIHLITEQLRDNTQMVAESLHDIGLDYAKTLAHWRESFLANWPELQKLGYDDTFKRLWLYYLGYCEAGFMERATSTVQIVARK